MAHGKNLAGNFEILVPDQTGSTQTPVHLCSFENRCVQLSMIFLQRGQLNLQLPATRLDGTIQLRETTAVRDSPG